MQSQNSRPEKRWRYTSRRLRMILIAIAAMLLAKPSFAHPMGNFSISHYSGITIERGSVEVLYLIDMAEIPTFQQMQQTGITASHDDPNRANYLAAKSAEFVSGLHVTVDGHDVQLHPVSQNVIYPAGAGGLPTMKLGFLYRGKVTEACKSGGCQLNYEDSNFLGRAGWKEIVVNSDHDVILTSSTAPDRDRSSRLSNYPTDMLNSPPQALQASVTFFAVAPPMTASSPSHALADRTLAATIPSSRRHAATASAKSPSPADTTAAPAPAQTKVDITPNQQKTPRSAFTQLIAAPKLGIGMALLAALIAAGLGALHALEPGHGKTIVAAYLVGAKGTARHAFLLGMIVTITHTAGVYLLGAVTLYAQKYILPEKLYPFLGVLSGILVAGMGFYLFLQRYVGGDVAHSHSHGPAGHTHLGLLQSRSSNVTGDSLPTTETPAMEVRKSLPARQLLVLGITGGIVPCPAALVVLLSAIALHRVIFGLFLIVAFSAGLAVILIALGMAAVYARSLMSQLKNEGPLIQRWLPLTSAAMIFILGCAIAVRGLMVAGVIQIHL